MRKLRHGELEECFVDPIGWVARKLATKGRPRVGYDRVTKLSIYKFHTTGSLALARQHLARLLSSYRLSSPVRAAQCEDRLEEYSAWFSSEPPTVVKCKQNILLDISCDWFLSGEVGRIDYLGEEYDYRGVLLESSDDVWMEDLRMPLLQRALAGAFHRRDEEFCMALQGLDGVMLDVRSFSSAEIEDAMVKARNLAEALSQAWMPES